MTANYNIIHMINAKIKCAKYGDMGTEGKKLTLPEDYGRLHRRGSDLLDRYEFAMQI